MVSKIDFTTNAKSKQESGSKMLNISQGKSVDLNINHWFILQNKMFN